ncbi:MAG: AAA family ATPase [Deltaproteobacteria bacterium HGW-Deltaproteobacteria-15]|jgi:wobble nucleotide-excising tRNase|nr:MAG: AAA family ATPase [Deltaproteobacteria bacterium HGW-Deltaproteobacteria-15]
MISSIQLAGTATFANAPENLFDLSTFNFVYGANATGKTTISRVIADESSYPSCKVAWQSGTKLQPLVYNRDFVETNFNQCAELKGVFTLGEKNIDTTNRLATTKGELDTITRKIEILNLGLHGEDGTGGKKDELTALEAELKTKCWAQKQKHDAKLQGAFEGFRNNAEKFKGKVLIEWASNSASVETLSALEKKAETVFGPSPTSEKSIPDLETDAILAHEKAPILKKRVIGKDDVDVAAMIRKLGNSDWVREGRGFYDANQMVCPFCQQDTTDAFAKSLNDYFDETFEADSKAIDDLVTAYKTASARLQQQIASIIAEPCRFIDVEKLKGEKELLDSTIMVNIQRLTSKKKEPSQAIELESIVNIVKKTKEMIDAANVQVSKHNTMVANLAQERRNLTAQVWKYLLETELKTDLESYRVRRDALNKAIAAMTEQISLATSEKKNKAAEIRELEKQTTSIQPTIDGINALLASFGFQSFSIAKSDNRTCYRLLRSDGSDAKDTLSEGEKNFVTFLYFYYLLKGSDSETGMTTDRVVVIDDPVSSLDSDILFIVSSLIKDLFDEVRAKRTHVKQVFILTHNIYFHREVTFNRRRTCGAMNEETFWVVRKSGPISKIEKHNSNPVSTSYELLWAEVRNPDRSNLAIQNTLRRILENYFKILGGVDSDEICEMFEGKEKLVCKALFSWVNEGSHYALDDIYMAIDDNVVETYLQVFKKIFEKSGHSAHYVMMMARS